MSNLDKAQLAALTERVTARLGEWGKLTTYMPDVSPGLVRLVVDVYEAMLAEENRAEVAAMVATLADYVPVPDDDRPDPPPAPYSDQAPKLNTTNGFHVRAGGTEQTPWEPATYPDGAPRPPLDAFDEAVEYAEREMSRVDDEEPDAAPADATEKPADVLPPAAAPMSDMEKYELEADASLNHTPPDMEEARKAGQAAHEAILARTGAFGTTTDSDKTSPLQTAMRDQKSPPPAVSAVAAATLGPEHTVVTPLKKGKPPVTELVSGAVSLGNGKPRTLAEVDGEAGATLSASRGRGAGNVLPDLAMLVKEVKRQAMGGRMPSQTTFNGSKPANWASASAHMTRLGITWDDLAKEAGLKPNQRRQ